MPSTFCSQAKKFASADAVPAPEVSESEIVGDFRRRRPRIAGEDETDVVSRLRIEVHLRDMIDVGLVDETWLPRLPSRARGKTEGASGQPGGLSAATSSARTVLRSQTMFRLFVRIGVTTALSALMIYLYLVFISIYQENQPLSDLTLETTVREKSIARPGETADVRWVSPYEPQQWIVVFDVDRVVLGRFEKSEIRFLVHSPSADLGVREMGQQVLLERRRGEWKHP